MVGNLKAIPPEIKLLPAPEVTQTAQAAEKSGLFKNFSEKLGKIGKWFRKGKTTVGAAETVGTTANVGKFATLSGKAGLVAKNFKPEFVKQLKSFSPWFKWLAVVAEIPAVYQGFKNGDGGKQLGRSGLNIAGGLGGWAAGAAIGTILFPGVGTIIGGIIGGLAGGFISRKVGEGIFGKSIADQKQEYQKALQHGLAPNMANPFMPNPMGQMNPMNPMGTMGLMSPMMPPPLDLSTIFPDPRIGEIVRRQMTMPIQPGYQVHSGCPVHSYYNPRAGALVI